MALKCESNNKPVWSQNVGLLQHVSTAAVLISALKMCRSHFLVWRYFTEITNIKVTKSDRVWEHRVLHTLNLVKMWYDKWIPCLQFTGRSVCFMFAGHRSISLHLSSRIWKVCIVLVTVAMGLVHRHVCALLGRCDLLCCSLVLMLSSEDQMTNVL